MIKTIKTGAMIFIACFALSILSRPLEAQYFGRNKVQYQKFDYKIIKTQHFDVYFYPEFRGVAEESARMVWPKNPPGWPSAGMRVSPGCSTMSSKDDSR